MWVTAYYTTWGACDLPPQNIDYDAVTHIVHQSIDPTTNPAYAGRWWKFPDALRTDDQNYFEQGIGTGCPAAPIQRMLIDSAHAHGVKVLLGLGANEYDYAAIASNETMLLEYVSSVLSYARSRGYDGVDIDWEFVRAPYRQAFINMINVFRNSLDQWSPRGLLTVAVPGWYNPNNDVATMNAKVDQVNLMTYDMAGWWDPVTGFNAALHDPGIGGYTGGNADVWTNGWLGNGLNPAITGFGVPFYGLAWEGVDGPGQGGFWSEYQVSYNWIMDKRTSGSYVWHQQADVPYLSIPRAPDGKKYFITFDDSLSLSKKVQYAKSKSLGGIMIFELWRGLINGDQPLMRAVSKAVWNGTTGPQPPPAPSLAMPEHRSVGLPTSPVLSWNPVGSATSYRLQIALNPDFSTLIVDAPNLLTTYMQTTGLQMNRTYYWRVRGSNTGIDGDFSAAFEFTTIAPPRTVLLTPQSLDFGRVVVKTLRQDSITITNNGTVDLVLSNSSASSAFFVGPGTLTILPGGSEKMYITFSPVQRVLYQGEILVRNESEGTTDTVRVSGRGGNPARARRDIPVLAFGNVPVGTSKLDTFTVYNEGDLDLHISSVFSSKSIYTVIPSKAIIPGSGSQLFTVTASPTSPGDETGYIHQIDNGIKPVESLLVKSQSMEMTGVGDVAATVPTQFRVHQNYPNPFNPSTVIRYDLPEASTVSVTIFNALGQEVVRLVENASQSGTQQISWNAGADSPSGVYLFRVTAISSESGKVFSETKKMLLTK